MADRREYSTAYERNRGPILEVLREIEPGGDQILEVGSGSGQHVCDFAKQLLKPDGSPYRWQPTEQEENLESIDAWRAHEGVEERVASPIAIDLLDERWDEALLRGEYAMVMSINVVHIVAWEGVLNLLAGASRLLEGGGVLYLYGPYRAHDREIEPSNEAFDQWLKERFIGGGLRYQEDMVRVASERGLELVEDVAMPANNRSLIFRKS